MAVAFDHGLRSTSLCGTITIVITILLAYPIPANGAQEDSELPIGEVRYREVETDSVSAAERPDTVVTTAPLYNKGILVGEIVADDEAVYIGGTVCIRFLPKVRTGLFLSLDIRTSEQAVREGIRDNYFIQRKETRGYVAIGLEQVIRLLPPLDIFIQAAPAYTKADFKGTGAEPQEGWVFLGRVGLAFRFAGQKQGSLLIRLGYQYSDLKTNGPSMFYGAFGLEF